MKPSTTVYATTTVAPYFHKDLLLKRAGNVTCGDLRGAYDYIQAPICAGQTSICTFRSGYQGCCDTSSSCQFYTTCNGAYATEGCTGSQCLACSQSAPYCVKYNFAMTQDGEEFEGYSCADFQFDSSTVYGLASAIPATLTSTSSSSASMSQDRTSTSISPSPSPTTSLASTASPTSSSESKSHRGAIAGGAAAGVVGGLALLALGAFFIYKRRRRNRNNEFWNEPPPEAQQLYRNDSTVGRQSYSRP